MKLEILNTVIVKGEVKYPGQVIEADVLLKNLLVGQKDARVVDEKAAARPPATSSTAPTGEEALLAMSYAELREMAKAAGLSVPIIGLSKERLVEMLLSRAQEQGAPAAEPGREGKDRQAPETASLRAPEAAVPPDPKARTEA